MEQLDNIRSSRNAFIGIGTSSILLLPEGDNSLFFTGNDSSFKGGNRRSFNDDLYLLLLVYVRCFCAPVFPIIILNILSRYKISEQDIFDENPRVYISENIFFMESKFSLSVLSFLRKEQVEFNLIYRYQF